MAVLFRLEHFKVSFLSLDQCVCVCVLVNRPLDFPVVVLKTVARTAGQGLD